MECEHLHPVLQDAMVYADTEMTLSSFFETVVQMLPWAALAACVLIATVFARTVV
jgi:hypothetical protein